MTNSSFCLPLTLPWLALECAVHFGRNLLAASWNEVAMNASRPEGDDFHEEARRDKLRRIAELGHDPWGRRFDAHQAIGEICGRQGEIRFVTKEGGSVELPQIEEGFDFRQWLTDQGPGELVGPPVRAAGRIVLLRDTGKLFFIDLRDWTGRIQLFVGKKQVGEDWELARCFDLGDLIGVEGQLRRTRSGELTIFAERLHFLCKALHPPPEKYHGMTDPELRQRMRYLDLAYGEDALPRFMKRTQIIQSFRQTLGQEGFVEVEGPTLHTVAGGRPHARLLRITTRWIWNWFCASRSSCT